MKKTIFIPAILIVALGVFAVWYWHRPKNSVNLPESNETLIVGTNAEYPPFSFIKDGVIVGFDIDLAREVSKRIGKKMELLDMPFEMLLPKVQLGEIQIIAAGMTATPERKKQVLFTNAYLVDDPLLIVSPMDKAAFYTVEDLRNKEVVVNDGYTADTYISSIEGPIVRRLATPAEAILALRAGRADAFVTARSAIKPFLDLYGKSEFRIVEIPHVTDNYALVISHEYPFLLCRVQAALDDMEKDGTLAALKTKWKIQ